MTGVTSLVGCGCGCGVDALNWGLRIVQWVFFDLEEVGGWSRNVGV